MKKIFGLTVAALMVIALVGGGTWAYFSDVETSVDNTFTAGTLDLTPDTATIHVISYSDVNPGWSNVSGSTHNDSWTLTNSGNVDGDLIIAIGAIANADNGTEDPEDDAGSGDTGNGDLGAALDVVFWADLNSNGSIDGGVWFDTNSNGYMDAGEGEKMYDGDLDSMPATYPPSSGKIDLDGSGSIDVYFDASVATTVGNGIMGDSCTFDITFQLDQTP